MVEYLTQLIKMNTFWINILLIFGYRAITAAESQRLNSRASYLVAVPNTVRPMEVLRVHVSVFELRVNTLDVTASVRKEGTEYAAAKHQFTAASQALLLLKVPATLSAGNYTLIVSGQPVNGGGYIFYNETQLTFHPKAVSVFIHTDRKLFKRSDTVKFRVVAVTKELMPVKTGSITIFVKDPHGKVLYRFLSQVLNNGYYANSVKLPHSKIYGWWTIEVHGWGYIYNEKFYTIPFYSNKLWMNATIPSHIFDNEYGIEGSIESNFTSGYPVHGNATVSMELYAPGRPTKILEHQIPEMRGKTSFLIPMSEIQKAAETDSLAGTKIKATINAYDWFTMDKRFQPAVVRSEIYSSQLRVTILGELVRTFKPLQQFPIVVAFHLTDGSPYKSQTHRLVDISVMTRELSGMTRLFSFNRVISEDGIIATHYTPDEQAELLTIRVFIRDGPSSADIIASKHQTRSQHHLSIVTSTTMPTVNNYMVFTVRVSTYIPVIYYMVLSKGNILFQSSLSMKSVQHTFSLAVSRSMIPEAKIIVYSLLNGKEVLADTLQFHVKGIRSDFKVNVNRGKDLSRDTVELTGEGDKTSFVAFTAAQYELYRRGIHSLFTEYQVEEDLLGYEPDRNTSYSHLFYDEENRPYKLHFNAPSYGKDPNSTFEFAGLTVFTDADLYQRQGSDICNISRGFLNCFDGLCYEVEKHCDGIRDCDDGTDEIGCERPVDIQRPDEVASMYPDIPAYDTVDWVWKTSYTKPHGRVDLKVNVPFRPRTWLVSGFTLSHTDGLSFSEHPARLDTARLFYIVLEQDKVCYSGEQLGMQVAVFNYWDQSLECIVMLHGSKDYRFVNVGEMGVVDSYNPRTTAGDVQTMVYLEAGEAKYVHLPILPTRSGKIQVTVSAESLLGRYTATHSITVKMDGVTNTYHTPYLIDLVNKGSVLIPHLWIPVPERFALPEQREHLYVPGSQEATVSIVGDIFGPSLTKSYPDIFKVFDIIEGNAFQTGFGFGYNTLLLKYLKLTNQLEAAHLNTVLKEMAANLVKMSAFFHKDGGAMMAGRGTPEIEPNAFYLQLLGEASESEWEWVLYIDRDMVDKMVQFLVSQQNGTTGAFHAHTIHDMRLRSNQTDENGNLLDLPLTAQVILGLSQARRVASGAAVSAADGTIHRAAEHLAKYIQDVTDPFVMCFVTYALHLANHRAKSDALTLMQAMAYKGEYVYWSPEEIPPNPSNFVNSKNYLYARELPGAASSRAVQATAYALQVYLRNNLQSWDTQAIMMWLQTQRDVDTGFIGIIDTLAASKALLEYAKRDTNRELYHLETELDATASPNWTHTHVVKSDKLAEYATFQVPNVFGGIAARAKGTGMALLQMTTKMNVEYPWQLRHQELNEPWFDLYVKELQFLGRNMSHFKMDICAKWLRTDLSPTSDSCIIEIDIPTGFGVKKDTLIANQRTRRIIQTRARFTQHRVALFLDYVDAEGECWQFGGARRFPVANTTIQHMIRITDGFDRAYQQTSLYRTDGLFHQDICYTCGSFQCPYCPFYNSARTHQTTWPLLSIIGLITMMHAWSFNTLSIVC